MKVTKIITALVLMLLMVISLAISTCSIPAEKEPEPKELQTLVLPEPPIIEQKPKPEIMEVTATAYCPCKECSGPWGTSTATGATATEGRTIAVDPTIISYGTEVIIDGNTYVAEDTGAAINGNRIDIYFDSHKKAIEWGVKKIEIIISKAENVES